MKILMKIFIRIGTCLILVIIHKSFDVVSVKVIDKMKDES